MGNPLVLLIAASACAFGDTTAQGQDTTTVRRAEGYVAARLEIDSLNARWCKAYEARDVAGIMAVWVSSPVACSGEGEVAKGREPLEASATAIMRYNPIRASLNTEQFWLLDDNTAYEYGSYTITFVPEVRDTVIFRERYVAEWRRLRTGEWRLRLKIGLPSE